MCAALDGAGAMTHEPVEPAPSAVTAADRRYHDRRERAAVQDAVRRAARTVLAIAVFELVTGLLGALAQSNWAPRYGPLAEGEEGERIARQLWVAWTAPVLISCLYFALYLWARRAPIPALFTALALFTAHVAVELVIDPSLLLPLSLTGMRVVAFAFLLFGLRCAFQVRGAGAGIAR